MWCARVVRDTCQRSTVYMRFGWFYSVWIYMCCGVVLFGLVWLVLCAVTRAVVHDDSDVACFAVPTHYFVHVYLFLWYVL